MSVTRLTTFGAVVCLLAAGVAHADQRQGRERGRGPEAREARGAREGRGAPEARGAGQARGREARVAPEVRGGAGGAVEVRPARAARRDVAPRPATPRSAAPQYSSAPRHVAPRYAVPRYAAPQYPTPRYSVPQYRMPRYVAPRHAAPSYGAAPRYGAPRYAAPRHGVRVAPYGRRLAYRPVYRPGLGIGIYIGSSYGYRYPASGPPYYAAPYPYGYGSPSPAYGGLYAGPPPGALYGGVRLDVTPRDAAVYVDGYYAGIVDDFDGAWQRVALEPGPHRFQIEAPGHEPIEFDVNVQMNQTIRYRGDLQRMVP